MTIKEFFSWTHNRYFWLHLIGVISAAVLLALAVMKWIDIYTHHGEAVEVPSVLDKQPHEATLLLKKEGLRLAVVDSTYIKDKPTGIILAMKPEAGKRVKEGRTVYVTINALNVPMRAVPDVADNSSLRQAQAGLMAVGFKLTEPEETAGEPGWVYGVKYQGRFLQPGEKVPAGATLTLVVGSGQSEQTDSLHVEGEAAVPFQESGNEQERVDDSWF